ncbi:GNAT family N-acetyltransferase [Nocardioides marinquilinus]|uniref:GNAT family N-acetyltransferase n=1 Tax=Nocardioides marinquilinus TaxID=1210400 RepID=A0ABP9PIX9_9ACTN
MTALALPDVRLHRAWAAALRDFGDEFPHGSGLDPADPPPLTEAGCAAFAAGRRAGEDAVRVPPGRVPCTHFWVVDPDVDDPEHLMVGFLAVRHALNAGLREEGGHVGYSVRPAARRRGHASRALALGLRHAAGLGLERVLLTCDEDNLGSRRTIEGAGGRLDDARDGRRWYWIEVPATASTGRRASAAAPS